MTDGRLCSDGAHRVGTLFNALSPSTVDELLYHGCVLTLASTVVSHSDDCPEAYEWLLERCRDSGELKKAFLWGQERESSRAFWKG
jgi:hypothetical protein